MSMPRITPCAWFLLAVVVSAQAPGPAADPSPRTQAIRDLFTLLDVGVGENDIIAHFERQGWPTFVTESELRSAFEQGAGDALRSRLTARLTGGRDLAQLSQRYRIFDAAIRKGPRISLLQPKDWHASPPSADGRRYEFRSIVEEGWFKGTTVFAWFYDLGAWRESNVKAMTRLVFDGAKRRLEKGGIAPGATTDDRLIDEATGSEFPFQYCVCVDDKTGLTGVFGLTAKVDPEHELICVMGFAARVNANDKSVQRARTLITEMLSAVKITKR